MGETMTDFSENERGIYRITSNWNTIDSYITRDGDLNDSGCYSPSSTIQLQELNENSLQWSSMKWRLVVGNTNFYRIQWLWAQGYLRRGGKQDSSVAIGSQQEH
jgi:hypothetical protein